MRFRADDAWNSGASFDYASIACIFLISRSRYTVSRCPCREAENEMISQSAEYSLRAVLCLASQRAAAARAATKDRAPPLALTTRQIAERCGIPAGYLAKLLQAIGRAG